MNKFTRFLAVLASVSLLSARQEQRSCASHPEKWREELRLHQQSEAALAKTKSALAAKAVVRPLADIGSIAHLSDADGVVAKRNPFNLNAKTLRFVPSEGTLKYRYEVTGPSYDAAAAAGGILVAGIGDDDSRELPLPFAFPFFGSARRSIYLNSDGNVTFGQGDVAITDRSLGRFLAGSPRIAALFTDLDPTRAQGGIRVQNEPTRVVISWSEVPEYRDVGAGPLQTFQLRLHSDGLIEIAYSSVSSVDVVAGITPGLLQSEPKIVGFLSGTDAGPQASAIVERFSGSESVDIFAASQKFYRNHEDAYDYLVIYNTLGIPADDSAVAYEVTVRNHRSGYGDPKTDVGLQAGSARRLQAILNMGPLSQYPADPNGRVPARLSVGDTPLSTIAHETGHLFLAYVSVEDASGNTPMLGHQSAHWDFKFNSDASLLEGNRIQDNGAGASPRFLTIATVEGFSALDQYLMGFRPLEQVPNTFYVANARGATTTGLPRVGVAFDGDRRDVSIQDIVAASGRRTPDHTVAQRGFRLAFLVITPEGQTPTADQLAQVDNYRKQFEAYFHKATAQTATASTDLRKAVHLSAFPAVGVLQGGSAAVTITLQQAAPSAITFLVKTGAGVITAPQSATIPAGANSATFNLAGVAEGVGEIIVEPQDAAYATIAAKVQVLPAAKLQLKTLSEASPVRLKVTDVNELPYPGVTVQARTSAGGSVDQAAVVSDADGTVQFRWSQSDSANQLVASIASGPSVTILAGAKPAFAAGSVLNAASYAPGLVPGGIGSIFGVRLGGSNARVLINGTTAQLLFGNDGQLNFVVPAEVPVGTANVVVQSANTTSNITQIPVLAVQPGVFFDSASGVGAIVVAGTGQLTTERPAQAGDFLEVYATGLGLLQPQVTIGGVPAEVVFSGLAPGFFGLNQINVRVPVGVAAGSQALLVSSGGVRSNEVQIRVR
jgi:uncharacterized protein (TIGR03437 family)